MYSASVTSQDAFDSIFYRINSKCHSTVPVMTVLRSSCAQERAKKTQKNLASQFSFLFWPVKLLCKLQNAVSYHTCFTIFLWVSKVKMYPPKDKYIISNFFGQPLYHVLHVGSQRSQKCVWPRGRPAAVGYTSGEVCVRESGRIKSRVYNRNRSGVFRPNI